MAAKVSSEGCTPCMVGGGGGGDLPVYGSAVKCSSIELTKAGRVWGCTGCVGVQAGSAGWEGGSR